MLQPTRRLFAFATASLVLSYGLYSCKKSQQEEVLSSVDKASIPGYVLDQWKKEGYSATYLLNKKSTAIFIDEDYNEVSMTGAKIAATCDPEEDDFIDNIFYMQAEQIGYSCDDGYTMQVNFTLSTAFTPVQVSPSDATKMSRGRFRLKDASGNVIYSNTSVTPVTISYIGPDLYDANKSLYQITYLVTGIPDIYMEAAYSNEHRPIIYSDCEEVITTPADWQEGVVYGSLSACSKIDVVHITPAGSNQDVYFGGCDYQINTVGSCYPSSAAASRPDEHDIEWRKPGDATFDNWPTVLPLPGSVVSSDYDQRISWAYLTGQGCTSATGKMERLAFYGARTYHFPSTGTFEIRYRNVRLETPVTSCSANECVSEGWVYKTIIVQ